MKTHPCLASLQHIVDVQTAVHGNLERHSAQIKKLMLASKDIYEALPLGAARNHFLFQTESFIATIERSHALQTQACEEVIKDMHLVANQLLRMDYSLREPGLVLLQKAEKQCLANLTVAKTLSEEINLAHSLMLTL